MRIESNKTTSRDVLIKGAKSAFKMRTTGRS